MKKLAYLFIVLFSTTLLSGCLGKLFTSSEDVRNFYTLSSISNEGGTAHPLKISLVVQKPVAGPGLNGEKIVLMKESYQMDYYARGKWIAELPKIVQASMIESLENTHQLPKVGNTVANMEANYLLLLEIRAFQAEYYTDLAAPEIHIKMVMKLMTAKDHKVVNTGEYEVRMMAADNTLDDVMDTFNQAYQGVEREVVNDVLKKLRKHSK